MEALPVAGFSASIILLKTRWGLTLRSNTLRSKIGARRGWLPFFGFSQDGVSTDGRRSGSEGSAAEGSVPGRLMAPVAGPGWALSANEKSSVYL